MFKLPGLPDDEAESHELADFAELLAWSKGSTSAQEIIAVLGRLGDNDQNTGCDDNDDKYAEELDDVSNEIERRALACGKGYPFVLVRKGTVLRFTPDDTDHRSYVYRYLLLGTRLNMLNAKVHASIDGTGLLEEIAANVLRCYLGSKRARSIIFGTATPGGFATKVDRLCKELGEGNKCVNRNQAPITANDGKLDTVAWIPFADRSRSQLIIFGQCKTGSTWGGTVTQLQPETFIKKWIEQPFLLTPLRAFCVAESADRARWNDAALDAGLLFDRCRLVDFCEELDSDLLKRIRTWTDAAHRTISF